MSDHDSPRSPELQALADSIELLDVSYTRMSAVRENIQAPSQEIDLKMSYRTETSADGTSTVTFQAQTEVDHPKGHLEVTVEAEYALPTSKAAWLENQELMLSFGSEVALFTLVPYLRQAISDMSSRVLRSTVTIPLFKR